MTYEHLRPLEEAIIARRIPVMFRGQAWSESCREWVYFACFIDTPAVRERIQLADCVHEHAHRYTHDGQERGFECSLGHEKVMGEYEPRAESIIFRG